MKATLWVLLGLVVIMLLVGGTWAWRYFTAPIKGRVTAEEKIESGQNRIQKYNHFFDLCARAQEVCEKYKAQYEQLELTEDKDVKERILTRITALKGEYQRAVRKYNQDARKDYTAARFKSSKLPYQLPTNLSKEGVCLSCEAY